MDSSTSTTNTLAVFGTPLETNSGFYPTQTLVAIDIETDEADNFVGLALYDGVEGSPVRYYTDLNHELKQHLEAYNFIGHNLKGDARWLREWGVNVRPEQLVYDTMLASYVQNSTKESHGLKDLAKEYVGLEWPSYRDVVGSGRKKTTLDKCPVAVVASYCGSDVYATYRLYQYFTQHLTEHQATYLEAIEMRVMRILFEMELEGVEVDVQYLRSLDAAFGVESVHLAKALRRYMVTDSDRLSGTGRDILNRIREEAEGVPNVKSPAQIKELLLKPNGIDIESTSRAALIPFEDKPIVRLLLRYREVEKLRSTYTGPLLAQRSLPRIHSRFNQCTSKREGDTWHGIRTGRLSSSSPNLHNIPTRTETGNRLRRIFIARPGFKLIVADYKQIEYRLLAHFSQEPMLIKAFIDGRDVHEETGNALGVDRRIGKTLAFASIYGAQAKKISQTAKIPIWQASEFLQKYWRVLPKVQEFISFTRAKAKSTGGITTLLGRFIPIDFNREDRFEVFEAERQAVNYLIQGSAAEIIKIAMIDLTKLGYRPILQVHDELLFEVEENDSPLNEVPYMINEIKEAMETVVKLDVPLDISIHSGDSWFEGKGK